MEATPFPTYTLAPDADNKFLTATPPGLIPYWGLEGGTAIAATPVGMPTLLPTATRTGTVPDELPVQFEETFDDVEDFYRTQTGQYFPVVTSPLGKALQMPSSGAFVFGPGNLYNVEVSARIALYSDSLHIAVRQNANGYYRLSIATDGSVHVSYRNEIVATGAIPAFEQGEWIDIRFSAVADQIRVYIT